MSIPFRIIDTGVGEGRRQIAFDQALIDLHKAGRSPDTVRFLAFPPTVLIGRHQAICHEVRVEQCRASSIGLVRRITGGGAIYLDEGQVGWELVLSRRRLQLPTLAAYTTAICEALSYGLSQRFGIDARFRPRTDIEVDGRKLCGTGGFFDGDTLIYQGTVLVDAEPARMLEVLNVPDARPPERDLDRASSRLVTLKELLRGKAPFIADVKQAVLAGFAEKLGLTFDLQSPTAEEEALAARYHAEEIGTDAFVFEIDDPRGADVLEARLPTQGGTVSAFVRLEGSPASPRIRELLLTGDFFVLPPRLIYDLEAALRGAAEQDIAATVMQYFQGIKFEALTLSPSNIRDVILAAIRTSKHT